MKLILEVIELEKLIYSVLQPPRVGGRRLEPMPTFAYNVHCLRSL